jgi:hypothetical protein
MHDLQFREIARDAGIIGADGVINALKKGGPRTQSRSGKRGREGQEHQGKQRERVDVRPET